MRLIRWLLILVVAAWIVGEILVIPFAESRIEKEVAERNRDTATVEADIDSFPLVAGVIFTGNVRELTVTLDRVARQALTFAEVKFELSGIEVDRPAILRGDPRISDIDRGTVTATIELGALGRLASLAGVDVTVVGRTLRAGSFSATISDDLIPCSPTARVEDERIVLSCEIDDVPQFLLDAAQR
jgi:hypothetical protein